MKITVETLVDAPRSAVWEAWNDPEAIRVWNAASEDWHTTESSVDLREGGTFRSRMEARDGSAGFDFEGVYTHVDPPESLAYRMSDGREVRIRFEEAPGGVRVTETFDADAEHSPELQRDGWQAILDSFRRYVEARRST